MTQCSTEVSGRRRLGWATQACGGGVDECGNSCPDYGLVYVDSPQGRSISTDNWVSGLAINILMTDARRENCGRSVADMRGHWSESFVDGGDKFGSNLRNIPRKKTTAEYVIAIRAAIQSDLSAMMRYGVASSIQVDVKYVGNNAFSTFIDIIGKLGEKSSFSIKGQQSVDGFLWGVA